MLHKILSFYHSSIHQLKFFCLLLVLPCLALQCNKDKDDPDPDNGNGKEQLPPATQSGENTFGCLVNGKVWRPKDDGFWSSKLKASYGRGTLGIKVEKDNNSKREIISIGVLEEAYELGIHKINGSDHPKNNASFINQVKEENNITECIYKTDSINTGYLKLTRVDSIENIVSGRFEFTAVNDSCGDVDTIRVTKGRFDIKYAH
jgi:hypothetical protein